MTKYILDVTPIEPLLKQKPQQVVVLCHGYGGDGKDISMLAINWQRFLPNALFLCPNAPEICKINPSGFQWFDLESDKENIILEKSLVAEAKLNKFLDQVLDDIGLNHDKLSLVGFSQGCMISIQTALKKKEKINSLVGYSGKVINMNHLEKNIFSKPKFFLMHGEDDIIVPPTHLLESKEYLKKHGINIKTKMFKNCEHKISVQAASLGLDFLKRNLL
tara:strand:- start:771 stop:1427 length:657 start_codon:yes stop_codon:yes gene_type:complete